jgi:hypothetical protein
MLRELFDHAVEIGIAGAKAPSEPVPAAFGDSVPVRNNLELTCLSRPRQCFDSQPVLDEGRETRSLCLVALSFGAVDDLDLHATLLNYFS